MASNDYDDLLKSFMNNSAKAYDEDKNAREAKSEKLPTSYNVSPAEKKSKRVKRGREIEKELEQKMAKKRKAKKERTPAQKALGRLGKLIVGCAMIAGIVGVVCFSVIAIYGYSVVYGDPVFDLTEEALSQNQTSFIYGIDGDDIVEITRLHGEENRIWVSLDEMSEYLPKAIIATEDKRFYKHHGVDWIRTIGVLVKPSNSGQGGSTITQQLIKNLTDDNSVTYVRKFNEILRALNIERNYDKEQILEAYLNTIYLSNGCYGVKTAAERYFGKEVSDLNIAECACLSAITKAPTQYDPLINYETENGNQQRQKWILEEMASEDNGFITEEQYEEAINYKMIFTNSKNYKGSKIKNKNSKKDKDNITNYYVDYVITTVQEDLQKMGYTAKKAKDLVYGGGLKIYTAIDFDVQDALEDVYENYRRMPDETVQGAMCIMDYQGRVLGVVGGTGKNKGALLLNRATMSTRPPGSTIKPIAVYAPALEKSLNDDDFDIYWSTKFQDKPFTMVEGKPWPVNQGGHYSNNYVTLQYGLANSLNTISARTVDAESVEWSFDYLSEKFHLSSLDSIRDVDYGPMAIGSLTNGAKVLDITAAYAAFGNGGYYYEPYCYYKIEDSRGNVIIEKDAEKHKEEAISEGTAWVMNKLLQTVMTQGTGTSYKLSGIECFGKTGTTNDDKDRWFVGGTPNFIAATWYGYDKPKEVYYSLSPNPAGTIWKAVMEQVYEALNKNNAEYDTQFTEFDGIVQRSYCTNCGKLRDGTGVYGWYDKNNLPGYCYEEFTEEKEEDEKKDKKDDSGDDKGTDSKKEETTAEAKTTGAKKEESDE
ncbi:MAG: transglycosylase domain-containing protein [Eubacterium sp.]|nr:transglycosylase domain-containing protein [Eubacterium sp.]